jgi:hypothetical protein
MGERSRLARWIGSVVLVGLLLVLAGCDTLAPATPTPVPTATARPAPTRTPRPTATPAPTATLEPEAPIFDDTPTPLPPTSTPTPVNQGTPAPTFPPTPPDVAALLEDSYARMAALPGYVFTATSALSDFGRPINTRINGVYVRPDRLRWTTVVNDATTLAVIVGPDYFVSQDRETWTQVPGAAETLNQYRLWMTLHDAEGGAPVHDDDPTAPLRHLGYSLTPAHFPLPPQAEPWRLLEAGVWIGRDDHLLYRLDLAAQTANYLLEEHMYFSHLGAALTVDAPTEGTPLPDTTPPAGATPLDTLPSPEATPPDLLPPLDITPSEGFPAPVPTNTLIAEP